jgi:hypothetical protein
VLKECLCAGSDSSWRRATVSPKKWHNKTCQGEIEESSIRKSSLFTQHLSILERLAVFPRFFYSPGTKKDSTGSGCVQNNNDCILCMQSFLHYENDTDTCLRRINRQASLGVSPVAEFSFLANNFDTHNLDSLNLCIDQVSSKAIHVLSLSLSALHFSKHHISIPSNRPTPYEIKMTLQAQAIRGPTHRFASLYHVSCRGLVLGGSGSPGPRLDWCKGTPSDAAENRCHARSSTGSDVSSSASTGRAF